MRLFGTRGRALGARALALALAGVLAASAGARSAVSREAGPPPPASASAPDTSHRPAPGFFLAGSIFAGDLGRSWIRVGERVGGKDVPGTKLRLNGRDLGIDLAEEVTATLGYRPGADDAISFSFSHLFLWGSSRPGREINFNGATLQSGTRLSDVGLDGTTWLGLEAAYERTLWRFLAEERGSLALAVGIRADLLGWHFTRFTKTATSEDKDAEEEFNAQATPIPFVGLTLRVPLRPSLDLEVSARGFRANHWNTARLEGGKVFISQSFVDARLLLAYAVTDSLAVTFGYRLLYLTLDERSGEDRNEISVLANGLLLGVDWRF